MAGQTITTFRYSPLLFLHSSTSSQFVSNYLVEDAKVPD